MKSVWGKLLVAVLAAVFVFAAVTIIFTRLEYHTTEQTYASAADRFTGTYAPVFSTPKQTKPAAATAEPTAAIAETASAAPETPASRTLTLAPIVVDFASLQTVNQEIVGWLYCEDSPINYPVVQGQDNSYYLNHTYDRIENRAGAIFVEANNRPGFIDANTIIYGHHMAETDAMFSTLENWKEQSYYETHRCFYLLTPERDYRIDLLAGYTTSAYSETYQMIYNHGRDLDDYLEHTLWQSDFAADYTLDPEANYILLSTCAFSGRVEKPRYVLHGILIPLDSAGGKPIA